MRNYMKISKRDYIFEELKYYREKVLYYESNNFVEFKDYCDTFRYLEREYWKTV